MSPRQYAAAARAIESAYCLGRRITEDETRAEVSSLARKQARGTLDDLGEALAARIEVATGEDLATLNRSTAP